MYRNTDTRRYLDTKVMRGFKRDRNLKAWPLETVPTSFFLSLLERKIHDLLSHTLERVLLYCMPSNRTPSLSHTHTQGDVYRIVGWLHRLMFDTPDHGNMGQRLFIAGAGRGCPLVSLSVLLMGRPTPPFKGHYLWWPGSLYGL